MELFRIHMFDLCPGNQADDGKTVAQMLIEVILHQIMLERRGDMVSRRLIKSCVQMVRELSLDEEKRWSTELEKRFLQTSRQFYELEAAIWHRESTLGCRQRHFRIL